MNNNNMCNNNNSDEIAEILRKIIALQKAAVREEIREEFCDGDFLGELEERFEANTRPIQIFTDDDDPFHCPVERDEDGCNDKEHKRTCVFRAEKVEDGAVVLRALIDKNDECESERNGIFEENNRKKRKERFKSTDSFLTVRLRNIAAIRCLKDTFVNICIR